MSIENLIMNINEFRKGSVVRVENSIGEITGIDPVGYFFEVTDAAGSVKKTDKLSIKPVYLQRSLATECLAFDINGKLKVVIDSRDFYFQEKDGHIILLDETLLPLIHFWDLKTVHQLQNFYYRFTGNHLPIDLKNLSAVRQGNLHARQ